MPRIALRRLLRRFRHRGAVSQESSTGRRRCFVGMRHCRQCPGSQLRGRRANSEVGRRLHVRGYGRGMALRGRISGPQLEARLRLVDEPRDGGAVRDRCSDSGAVAPRPVQGVAASLGPGHHTAEDFQRLLAHHGIAWGISKNGDCHDNAAMESFFASLRKERGYTKPRSRTRDEDRADIFEYIEGYYNPWRSDSTLGLVSPVDLEWRFSTQHT